ncbi:hypothetical protein BST81_01415 [Leptolyngbya sp. 'hensonii']|uniref:hypothetical protein n=1 Tax=Leptolyngbya sp. 'hensonii' TaxID=1922337 RepID=UPI00094FCF06|nr:hypothetical protein [Leptolyngbya sp. 'hensonii']OLP20120.1 hypothetical protein BST81_01415 [Leptolyngbya sp. 'hensonii']
MNVVWPRFLKLAYRKEPISSFILIAGAVDVAIGGLDSSWSLATVGIGTVGVAVMLRWWLMQRSRTQLPEPVSQRYLPAQSSRPQMPMLTVAKQKPPRPGR